MAAEINTDSPDVGHLEPMVTATEGAALVAAAPEHLLPLVARRAPDVPRYG